MQAVSSRKLYSEHGFDALMRPLSGQVCHSLIVVSNCSPGSAEAQAACPMRSHNSRAGKVLAILPDVRWVRCQAIVGGDGVEKGVRHPHRIVRILPGDGQIGFRIPIGVVGAELDRGLALARPLDHALDATLRDHRAAGGANFALEGRVLRRIAGVGSCGAAIMAGRHDAFQMARGEFWSRRRARRLSPPRRPSSR